MTPTPALGRRVVLSAVGVVAVTLLAVNAGVYVAYRARLNDSLERLLDDRTRAVRVQAAELQPGQGPVDLARELQARGLRVSLYAPDGQVFQSDPDSPVLGPVPPPRYDDDDEYVSRELDLPTGLRAEVFARSAGVSGALRELLLLQLFASLVALTLAAVLLSRATQLALRPLHRIAAAARRTSGGERGERLHADRPHTELGRMVTAYDDMLDTLEAGYQVAARLERRSGMLETRWRQVLEAAEEAYVCVDADGTVADWNHRAAQLFGWPAVEIVGQPVARLLHPDHAAAVLREVPELVGRGPTAVTEPYVLNCVDREGREFPVECTVWGIERRDRGVVHAFVRDIGPRRQSEDAVARLAAVVEGSSDAIITQTLDGTILTWNPAAERMYGWTAEQAVGRHMSLVVPEARLAELDEMLDHVRRGERVAGRETERTTRGGELLPVSVRLSPVHDRHGRVVAASAIARDVTEQRWMAETLNQTLAALQAALDEARASEETTRRFLADAAHQLRTPMAGIRACAETLLRASASPEDADRLLATMVRETSRAARLIAALLQIARLDQGGLGTKVEPVDVVALCAAEVDRLSLLSPDLDVEVRVLRSPSSLVMLDAGACQEILSNLGDNARRHARERIELVVDAGDAVVSVRVVDDGGGVPVERREEIFERFVSLDARGGSGLGLPIARGLARSMGGELVYDEGFLLELPVVARAPVAIR